jgi:predicted Na+-dependent transporter
MVMLFFPFLDNKISLSIFKEKRLYILLFSNISIGLCGYFLLINIDQNLAFSAFLVGITPTATACPAVMGFLKGRVDFAFAAVIVSNIFMSFFLPLTIPTISDQPIEVYSIFYKTVSVIFIPLIAGKSIQFLLPKIRKILIQKKIIGFYSWLAVCFLAVAKASSFLRHSSAGLDEIVLIAGISGAVCYANFSIGRRFGGQDFSLEMSQTLGQKNTTLTIWIGLTYFNPLISLGPIFYLIYHNLYNAYQLAIREYGERPWTLFVDKWRRFMGRKGHQAKPYSTCYGYGEAENTFGLNFYDDQNAPLRYPSVMEWIGDHVANRPEAIAIEHGALKISYAKLDSDANCIANQLLEIGLKKGDVVGLLFSDKVNIVPAILGVMKVGGVFCPMDPELPDHLFMCLLTTTHPDFLICESAQLEKLASAYLLNRSEQTGPCVLISDANPPTVFDCQMVSRFLRKTSDSVDVNIHPDDPSYIFFTSDPAGAPKPILGRTLGLSQIIQWESALLETTSDIRVTQLIAPTFDMLPQDIFLPLCSGGTLCFPENQKQILNAEKLLDWLEQSHLNVIRCSPATLRLLRQAHLDPCRLPHLEYILLTGKELLPNDVSGWYRIFGDRIQLYNLYGASDATVINFRPVSIENVYTSS